MSPKFLPESYTPVEKQRIAELQKRLSDLTLTAELLHPSQLIRWLRARSLNVEKANIMLRKHLEWRKLNGVDGILERERIPEEFKSIMPLAYAGLDGDGYPILIAAAEGRRDVKQMLEKYGVEESMKIYTVITETLMELLQNLSREQGRPVTQFVEIVDMEGFSFRQFASKAVRDFMGRSQTSWNDNYPEILRYAMIINAPKAFYIAFNLFKPFIPKETLDKFDLFGTDKEKWRKVVAEKFAGGLDGIPPHWGGCREGKDEYCSGDEKMWLFGQVSRSLFDFGEEDASGLITKTINARDDLKLRLSVTSPGSSILWRVRIDSHDIDFQIVDQDGKEVMPLRKIKAQNMLEEGCQECREIGIYTVIFDNSYSWARSKTIHYNVSVIGDDAGEGGGPIKK